MVEDDDTFPWIPSLLVSLLAGGFYYLLDHPELLRGLSVPAIPRVPYLDAFLLSISVLSLLVPLIEVYRNDVRSNAEERDTTDRESTSSGRTPRTPVEETDCDVVSDLNVNKAMDFQLRQRGFDVMTAQDLPQPDDETIREFVVANDCPLLTNDRELARELQRDSRFDNRIISPRGRSSRKIVSEVEQAVKGDSPIEDATEHS